MPSPDHPGVFGPPENARRHLKPDRHHHPDPLVYRVVGLMCDEPARSWTVASLAAEVHISRATLARRFTLLVGQPPMAFLAAVRLERAAEILRESDCATIEFIARRVGYGNSFALSVAFKRRYGVSPSDYRKAFQRVSRTSFQLPPTFSLTCPSCQVRFVRELPAAAPVAASTPAGC